MKKSLPYIRPATDSELVYTDGELMEQAVETFERGEYAQAIGLLIDALNEDFREKYGNANGTSFKIPHGSIVVNIDITADSLKISADFLKLPQKGRVAMLRQIAEMNINNLMLARFVKNGDFLQMEYKCPLSDTHPHKIHAVIHNICAIGDKYDDEFCTRFNAQRCYTPRVQPFTPEEVDHAYDGLQIIGSLALMATEEYLRQRRYIYAWTIIRGAIYQFCFFANPQGQLINDIEKALESMQDERPLEELVARGTAFLKNLLDISQKDLAADLYSVEMMVSMKIHTTLQEVQEDFEDLHEGITQAMQERDYDQVVTRLYYSFYQLLAENNIPLLLEFLIVSALQKSADKPMKEAAEILKEAIDKIMEGDINIPDDDTEDDDTEDDDTEDDDDVTDEDEDEEALAAAHANVVEAHQRLSQAMSTDEIVAMQKLMDEALKAGNVAEYMRLATELQMRMINSLGS